MTDYPKEIYVSTGRGVEISDPTGRVDREKAYDLGKQAANSLDGWSNLTQAIENKENIDWEKLDGLPAKCVHPELGTLTHKLERDGKYELDDPLGWYTLIANNSWKETLRDAWFDMYGWQLYIEGDIPLKHKTADQLPVGMCFEGKRPGDKYPYRAVVVKFEYSKGVILADTAGIFPAEEITVVKEYGIGTFNKEGE